MFATKEHKLNLCMLGNFSCFCCRLLTFFKINLKKFLSGTLSGCQTFWIQIRTNIMSVQIWVQTVCKGYQQTTIVTDTWWVVTWFLFGYTAQMFEYTVRTFWSNVSRFLYVSHLYPESYTPFFSPHFSQSNATRSEDILFKLLTLSTNSVTVVRTVYFNNSGYIFVTKTFVTESVLKVRSFMKISWHL